MSRMKQGVIVAVVILFLFGAVGGCGNKGGKLSVIKIEPSETTLAKGSKHQFTATAIFSDGTVVNWNAAATWSSADETVLTVGNEFGSHGLATAQQPDSASSTVVIKATDLVNNISGSAVVTVADPDFVTIDPHNPIMAVNTSHRFKAEALFSGGTKTQDITSIVEWTTAEPSIATILTTTTGMVKTFAAGSTGIRAVYSSNTATNTAAIPGSATVTVTSYPLSSIDKPTPDPAIITRPTSTQLQFYVEGTLADPGKTKLDMTTHVKWTSSRPGIIAEISNEPGSEGLATAKTGTGKTIITATDPITGKYNSITLTVQ